MQDKILAEPLIGPVNGHRDGQDRRTHRSDCPRLAGYRARKPHMASATCWGLSSTIKCPRVLQDDELRPLQVLVEVPPVFPRDEHVVLAPEKQGLNLELF